MRIVLASMGTEEFALLRATCQRAGHVPVAYAYSRAMRPGERTDEYAATVLNQLLMVLPGDVDLLLPASPAGLGMALSGYRPDLLVIYGFNWILPPEVFQLPRFGTINIHPGRLPRYRGPAPVHWAIRNGDPEIGVSVHRVDDGVDTGPILAQRGGIPLPEEVTRERVRDLLAPVVEELLSTALARVVAGDPGEPQPRTGADYAGVDGTGVLPGGVVAYPAGDSQPGAGVPVHGQSDRPGRPGGRGVGAVDPHQPRTRRRPAGGLRGRSDLDHRVGAGQRSAKAWLSRSRITAATGSSNPFSRDTASCRYRRAWSGTPARSTAVASRSSALASCQ